MPAVREDGDRGFAFDLMPIWHWIERRANAESPIR
jgi:hypothetical protein